MRRRPARPDPTRTTRAITAVTADAVTTRATATTRTNAGAGGKRRRLARQRCVGLFARKKLVILTDVALQREEKKRAKAGLAPVEWGKHGILTEAGQCLSCCPPSLASDRHVTKTDRETRDARHLHEE